MRWPAGVVASIAVALAVSAGAAALDVPKAPTLDVPIVDQTGTLTAGQIQQLADKIAASRKEKSYQIGILILPTLGNDEYLEGYSLKVARDWGIGEKDTSNGVLLLIVKDDRKLRIEVGRGLEGDLTDVRANRIIRNVITPKFKEGKYFEGISDGVNSIQLAVAAKPDPAAAKTTESVDWGAIVSTAVFIGIAVLSWLGAVLGRSKSWWAGGVIGAVAGLVLMSYLALLSGRSSGLSVLSSVASGSIIWCRKTTKHMPVTTLAPPGGQVVLGAAAAGVAAPVVVALAAADSRVAAQAAAGSSISLHIPYSSWYTIKSNDSVR